MDLLLSATGWAWSLQGPFDTFPLEPGCWDLCGGTCRGREIQPFMDCGTAYSAPHAAPVLPFVCTAKALMDDLLLEQGFVLTRWASNIEHLPPEARSKHCKALQRGLDFKFCLTDHHKPSKGSWQTTTIHWASLFPSQQGLTPPMCWQTYWVHGASRLLQEHMALSPTYVPQAKLTCLYTAFQHSWRSNRPNMWSGLMSINTFHSLLTLFSKSLDDQRTISS